MKIKMKLNELTLDAIINKINNITVNGCQIDNKSKHATFKAERHHLIGSRLNRKNCLILIPYNGSCAMVFYSGDVFTIEDNEIKIETIENEIVNIIGLNLTNKEIKQSNERAIINKSFSDSYWKSVEQEWKYEIEEDWN